MGSGWPLDCSPHPTSWSAGVGLRRFCPGSNSAAAGAMAGEASKAGTLKRPAGALGVAAAGTLNGARPTGDGFGAASAASSSAAAVARLFLENEKMLGLRISEEGAGDASCAACAWLAVKEKRRAEPGVFAVVADGAGEAKGLVADAPGVATEAPKPPKPPGECFTRGDGAGRLASADASGGADACVRWEVALAALSEAGGGARGGGALPLGSKGTT